MTVSSDVSSFEYDTDGVATSFPVPFYFLEKSDLYVTLYDPATETSTDLVLGSAYDVTGAGDPAGGSVTTFDVYPSGLTLRGERLVDVTQETAYQRNDPFPERAHERALDKLTMISQQFENWLGTLPGSMGRVIHLPVEYPRRSSLVPPVSVRARKALIFDDNGNVTVGTDDYEEQAENAAESARQAAESATQAGEARDEVRQIADDFGDLDAARAQWEAAVASSAASAVSADESADRAEAAAAAAAAAGRTFPDVAAGMAGTVDGDYFTVAPSQYGGLFDLYLHAGSSAQYLGTAPDSDDVRELQGLIYAVDGDEDLIYIVDPLGFYIASVSMEQFLMPNFEVSNSSEFEGVRLTTKDGFLVWEVEDDNATFGPMEVRYVPEPGILIVDRLGFLVAVISDTELQFPNFSVQTDDGFQGVRIVSDIGFLALEVAGDNATVGPLEVRYVPLEGVFVVDPLGFLVKELTDDSGNDPDAGGDAWATTAPSVLELDDGVTVAGRVVTIPAFKIRAAGGDVDVSGTALTLAQPSTATVTDLDTAYIQGSTITLNLIYSTNTIPGRNANPYLPNKSLSNVVVKRASDGTVLTLNTDYRVLADLGKVYGIQNIASFPILVSYTAARERYDLIQLNPQTGVISVKSGPDRDIDAVEYMPEPDLGNIPLYSAYVYGNPVQVELVPLYQWRNDVRRNHERELAEIERHNAKWTQRVRSNLRAGETITLIGYGDSITAQGGGAYNAPNGTGRDTPVHYLRTPADTRAAWTLYDHGDALGVGHVHLGWNWFLKDTLEERYGVTVDYLNFGLSGTTSANYDGGGDNNDRGGLDPVRLGFVLDAIVPGRTIVALCFGMNDGPNSTTFMSNMQQIILQLRNAGADVIVIGVPRTCSIGHKFTDEQWRSFNQQAWYAAQNAGAAFVSTLMIEDPDGAAGYSGIAGPSMTNSNSFNHPDPRQLRYIGQRLSIIFI